MKVFTYSKDGATAVITAFNRGHAVKLLAKELEKRGKLLSKEDKVEEIDLEDEKGKVLLFGSFQ